MNYPDDSLRELPLPYDISTAVSRALRLDSAGGAEVECPADGYGCPLTATDGRYASKDTMPMGTSISNTYVDSYFESIQLGMEVEAFSDNTLSRTDPEDLEQLDQFCKYIGSSGEDELEFPDVESPQAPYSDHRSYSLSDFPRVKSRSGQPPKKKCRTVSMVDYASSPEVSPVKYDCLSVKGASSFKPRYNWRVELVSADLWRRFDEIGTEMVITKNGRRIFPALSMKVAGLEPDKMYTINLDIIPADSRRYKFLQTEWVPVGRADKKQIYRQYTHPDSPKVGKYWMDKPITFKHLKLTNNKNTKQNDQMILNSMQKYQPHLRITCETDGTTQSYSFPETRFIAVTAYQSNKITLLKIDNNPYARAFRDGIPSDTERGVAEKKGGHYILREQRASLTRDGSSKEEKVESAGSTSRPSPASSPPQGHPDTRCTTCCTSAVSVESGFESGDCSDPFVTAPLLHCPLNYWADDNSLYNPALITPPPLLDSSSSFSEPYLQQTSRMVVESSQYIISPVKGLHGFDDTLIVDVETLDNDDVFM